MRDVSCFVDAVVNRRAIIEGPPDPSPRSRRARRDAAGHEIATVVLVVGAGLVLYGDVVALEFDSKALAARAVLVVGSDNSLEALVIGASKRRTADGVDAPVLQSVDQAEALLITRAVAAFLFGQAARPKRKGGVRVRVVLDSA